MKFKNSKSEESYNTYWNQHIVIIDKLIRRSLKQQGLFQADEKQTDRYIKRYHHGVMNIINNLLRQSLDGSFSDPSYVYDYLLNTIQTARADMKRYTKNNAGMLEKSVNFMDYLTDKKTVSHRLLCKEKPTNSRPVDNSDSEQPGNMRIRELN